MSARCASGQRHAQFIGRSRSYQFGIVQNSNIQIGIVQIGTIYQHARVLDREILCLV